MGGNNFGIVFTGIGLILCAIGLLLITPFIMIWSVNGLFGLHIEYTWMNWFYAFVIVVFVRGGRVSSK